MFYVLYTLIQIKEVFLNKIRIYLPDSSADQWISVKSKFGEFFFVFNYSFFNPLFFPNIRIHNMIDDGSTFLQLK